MTFIENHPASDRAHSKSLDVVSCLLLLVLAFAPQQGDEVRITGTVRDSTGLPLPAATVSVDGTLRAVSDDSGAFTFKLPAAARVRVVVSLPGFDVWQANIEARSGIRLDVVLPLGRISDSVTVRAPLTPAVEEDTTVPSFLLDPVQVYRTPGAQADIFRALQTLPGVAVPDDGAGLFVRGGDVSEVSVSLDDAEIAHPYRYETPTGGFRGAVDPLHITSLAFSSGGFSSRYGDVLSAVVSLRGQPEPTVIEAIGTVGLAGASASLAVPLGARAGVRGTINRTLTGMLFAVNGAPRHFDPAPEGWDASLGLGANVGRVGRIRGMALAQRDEVGVEIEQDAFVGLLRSSIRHRFVSGRWDVPVGQWAGAVSLGNDAYRQTTTSGVLNVSTEDQVQSWRLEASHGPWRIGGNGTFTRSTSSGIVPVRGGDYSGINGVTRFDVDVEDWFGGAYLETTAIRHALAITPGVRIDRFGLARATTFAPRLNVQLSLGGRSSVRFATGSYHQAPAPAYYDRERGALQLPPMEATHYVVGYEHGQPSETLFIRAEAYIKRYDRLPLQDASQGYTADGHGSARGFDAFVQWLTPALHIRGSTTWLDARRRWTRADQRERYDLPGGTWTPDFEIPWSTQLIATAPLPHGLTAGASWRAAAGRPHTPVVSAEPVEGGFSPVFGALNSERLPRYERLDLSLSQLVPTGSGGGVFIWFVSLDNALGRRNAFDYVYAADYSSRRTVTSAAPRSVYVGMTFRR